MRVLLLVDNSAKSKLDRIKAAADNLNADYATCGGFQYNIEYRDFSNLKWVSYDGVAKGIDYTYINQETKAIWDAHNLEYDNIIFCVDNPHWQDGAVTIGGWNLGDQRNGYYVQIIRIMDSDEWLNKAFRMEVIHCWDNATWQELTLNLNTVAGMAWDANVVHGQNPKWGKYVKGTPAEKWTTTDYYTNYDYTEVIKEYGSYFKSAMDRRKQKYDNYIAGLQTQISLIEKIIAILKLLRKKAPVEPLELESLT